MRDSKPPSTLTWSERLRAKSLMQVYDVVKATDSFESDSRNVSTLADPELGSIGQSFRWA